MITALKDHFSVIVKNGKQIFMISQTKKLERS